MLKLSSPWNVANFISLTYQNLTLGQHPGFSAASDIKTLKSIGPSLQPTWHICYAPNMRFRELIYVKGRFKPCFHFFSFYLDMTSCQRHSTLHVTKIHSNIEMKTMLSFFRKQYTRWTRGLFAHEGSATLLQNPKISHMRTNVWSFHNILQPFIVTLLRNSGADSLQLRRMVVVVSSTFWNANKSDLDWVSLFAWDLLTFATLFGLVHDFSKGMDLLKNVPIGA